MESPDRMVRLAYDPRGRPGGWAIQGAAAGRQEAWWATLALRTPVEILAGFTDALTHPRPTHAPNVWAPLKQQGWRDQPEAEHPTATSPDDTAWMTYEQGSSGTAWWRCGAKDAQGHGWDGYFTATTPMHLVQALSVALASPQPVMRPHGHVPHSPRIQTQPLSLLPNQLDAWQQDRLAAARTAAQARRTFTRPATAPPAARASRTRTPR